MSNAFVDLKGRATLLNNKLDKLANSIDNSASFNIQESYMAEAARILKNFYSDPSAPFFQFDEAGRDLSLLPSQNSVQEDRFDYDYNLFFGQLLDNLTVLFMEMDNGW